MNKHSLVRAYQNQEMGAEKCSLHINLFGPIRKDGHDILLTRTFCFMNNFKYVRAFIPLFSSAAL